MKWMILAAAIVALGGCTTAQEIARPDGRTEMVIGCGAATGFNICYAEANKRCPQGYETLEEKPGFNRKELRIACAAPKT